MSAFKKYGVISSLVLIAIGILFFVFRSQVTEFLALIIGLIILVIGAYSIIYAAATWSSQKRVTTMIAGIIIAALGIYLLFNGGVTIYIVGILIGIMAFLAGIDMFSTAVAAKKAGMGIGYAMISGIVHIVFGVVMCIVPRYGVSLLVMFMGLYMLIAGAMMLVSAIKFRDI